MATNEMTKNLGSHIAKVFSERGLIFEGEFFESSNDIIIDGTFLAARKLQFRFERNWGVPGNNSKSLRLTKVNSSVGVYQSELELELIINALDEAIRIF